MEKLDRLGWADGICFTAYGARVGIRVSRPEAMDLLPALLPPLWKPAASPVVDALYSLRVGQNHLGIRQFHMVYDGPGQVARTLDLREALDTLESTLHMGVAVFARRYLFVHAGVVGWKGRAVLLPGRSMTGKSSLVAALVRAGATYYSDEFAVMDHRGRVHPYPKPISVRREGGRPCKRRAEEEGGKAGTRPLPVGLVAMTEFREGATWRPRKLTPGEAMLALLDNTVLAQYKPDVALPILERTAVGAAAIRSRRGEADELAPVLLQALEKCTGAEAGPAR